MIASSSTNLYALQKRNAAIYGLQDSRFYSTLDLLVQLQRFTMRALKGIRKEDAAKLKLNLMISFSWMLALGNRLHTDLDEELWKRFPGVCSYCGKAPCECKKIKATARAKVKDTLNKRPKTLRDWQNTFDAIYPPETRSLLEAGVHLAEEMGEVSEAIHNFLGLHANDQFDEVTLEVADYASCLLGVANSADIDITDEFQKMFKNGCHVCHKTPCQCTFMTIIKTKS